MTTLKIAYSAETSITWSGAIASSATAGRECTAIDNTSNLYDDILVTVSIVYPNSAPANDSCVYFFAGGYAGATLGYQGSPALTGSDAAYTFDASVSTTATSLQPLGSVVMVQNKTRVKTFSIANAFGGAVPMKVGLALANFSGQTITTFTASYVGVTYTNA